MITPHVVLDNRTGVELLLILEYETLRKPCAYNTANDV